MSGHLWDRGGPPDPEVEELEQALAPLQLRATTAPAELWARCVAEQRRAQQWKRRALVWSSVAACLVVALFAARRAGIGDRPAITTSWSVTEMGGKVELGRNAATMAARLNLGQPIRTGSGAHATIEATDFGQVEVKPDSEMTIVETGEHAQRMDLRQGRIHALIWAPPREFVVNTPSANAIDLGCQYDLSVDPSGNGFLRVETGWVAFQFHGKESFIPAGAACRTSRSKGPGIPFFEDSNPPLREALERYELTGERAALADVLKNAREHDGLTLWHLLTRVEDGDRATVFDRFASIVKLPASVNRESALRGDRATLDACWDALQLDSAEWWREWKRDWH
jgi:hypothetical protein